MAKKDKTYKEVSLSSESAGAEERLPVEETMFEAEAYADSTPDPGMETTVLKPVGIGGPVPIVAPKNNTVQLQPIVVPLAVVPYMTQDSGVLRTDGESISYPAGSNGYAEAVEFEKTTAAKREKKATGKGKRRIFGLIASILSAAVVIPFILAYFEEIRIEFFEKFAIGDFNIIGAIMLWADKAAEVNFNDVLMLICAIAAALALLCSLFALISGKYPRIAVTVFSGLSAAPILIELLYRVIKPVGGTFYPNEYVALITVASLAALLFLVSVIFAIAVSQDKKEKRMSESENPI